MTTMTLDALAGAESTPARRRARSEPFKAYLATSESVTFAAVAVAASSTRSILDPVEARTLALSTVTFVFLSWMNGCYATRALTAPLSALPRVLAAAVLSLAWITVAGLRESVAADVAWVSAFLLVVSANRALVRRMLETAFSRGASFRRAIVIELGGSGLVAGEIGARSNNGIRAVATVRMGRFDAAQAIALARREGADLVAIEVPIARLGEALEAAEHLRILPADIAVVPDGTLDPRVSLGMGQAYAEPLARSYGHMVAGGGAAMKRVEDVLVSLTMIVVLSPLMLVTALLIRLESPGPALFRQRRVGFNEEVIEVWKFRSMQVAATDAGGARQTSRNDARVTRVGRFIRKTSIDELPQLVNVLRGTMSVVGPRPHPLEMRALGQRLEVAVPSYGLRHRVKPGLTGWAQVNGCRGEIDSIDKLQRRVDLDVEYIERWSVAFDLRIIATTAFKVVGDRAAY